MRFNHFHLNKLFNIFKYILKLEKIIQIEPIFLRISRNIDKKKDEASAGRLFTCPPGNPIPVKVQVEYIFELVFLVEKKGLICWE